MKPLKQGHRNLIAFAILCLCTFLILYTGPGFNFGLQVILSGLLLVFLFWFVT